MAYEPDSQAQSTIGNPARELLDGVDMTNSRTLETPSPPAPIAIPPVSDDEKARRQDDDSYMQAVLTAALIKEAGEKPAGVLGVVQDVTRHITNTVADALEYIPFVGKDLANSLRGRGTTALLKGEHSIAVATGNAWNSLHVVGDYFQDLAWHESRGRDNAHAPTSSAVGRYQFLEQTWLGNVMVHGAEHGGQLAWAARHIHQSGRHYYVDDPDDPLAKQKILDMRKDGSLATLIAKDFTNDNAHVMQKILGNTPLTNTDLYLAHFFGAGTAAKFVLAYHQNSTLDAAAMFPTEAAANSNIFYHRDGSHASLGEVRATFARDFEPGSYGMFAGTNAANNGIVVAGDSVASGTATALGVGGNAVVGRPPQAVVAAINANPALYNNKNVILSTGISNNTNGFNYIRQEFDALVDPKLGNAASVTVLGVGDRADFAGINDKLRALVADYNKRGYTQIHFAGALNNLSADHVHPSNYSEVASNALSIIHGNGTAVASNRPSAPNRRSLNMLATTHTPDHTDAPVPSGRRPDDKHLALTHAPSVRAG